jgi:hypothetical protein
MASFRALVLDFVRSYLTRWGQSPSYGEIAAGLSSNRTRVKRAVVSLEREGLLLRRPGTRGLALPDEIERARQLLERAGLLDANRPAGPQARTGARSGSGAAGNSREEGGAEAPPHTSSVTNPTLLPPPALDYPARGDGSEERRQDGNSAGSAH